MTIKAQQELRISWETKNSTHCFNALAAALFVAGFSATFLFAAPVVAVVGYAACMVAVAMYLSSGAYGDYKEKSLRFYDAEGNYDNARGGLTRPGLELIQAKNNSLQALQAARKEFWLTMARNVVIPTLMLALLAACWQAAVVFAVLYVGYTVYQHYHKPAKTPRELVALRPELKASKPTLLGIENSNDEDALEKEEQQPLLSAFGAPT